MRVPGSNILNKALTVISKQTFNYYQFRAREPNAIGLDVAQYYPVQILQGSAQPAPRELIEQMGLDLQRTYFNFYVSRAILDVDRDVSGDQMFFNGQTFQCLSITPWGSIDGWNAVLAVRIVTPSA